jgi:photosystem II stability/assembly factor-like uncharacterized protein
MHRSPIPAANALQLAAALFGVAAVIMVACSSSAEPARATLGPPAPALPGDVPTLKPQTSGTTSRLQAVSAVDARVVWVSGVAGTYAVTTDGGDTWKAGVVPGADTLEFRDVEAVSSRVAYLLASGNGAASRIYKTTDGGRSWQLQLQNADSAAFYDCFDFWSPDRGLTFSDPVNGRFPAIRTTDGRNWENIGERIPAPLPGEAAFAASGTCVTTQGSSRAWIATGAGAKARVFVTTDGGDTWNAYETPIVQGTPTSGGFSVAFRDASNGILGGGELDTTHSQGKNVAVSSDGGKTWTTNGIAQQPFFGAIFGLAYVPGSGRTVFATGPGGAAWSRDEGRTWSKLPPEVTGFWSVGFADRSAGWLVGTEGRILKVSF